MSSDKISKFMFIRLEIIIFFEAIRSALNS